jgi:hypothetical protein
VIRLVLGAGIAIGLSAECYFIGLASGIPCPLLEILPLSGLALLLIRSRRYAPCRLSEASAWLTCTFALLLIADIALFACASAHKPCGGWDAWAIYNLRARFLYRAGGEAWRDGFNALIGWSHPDYPPLLSAAVARGWRLLGRETNAVPIALAAFFTFALPVLTALSIGALRGVRQGILAGLVPAATPFLYIQGAMQCADVPVAFYRLASLAALALAERLDRRGFAAIAGLAAALGASTKNEGILWFAALVTAYLIMARGRMLSPFLAGAVPALAPLIWFKARIAPPSDIFGAGGRAGMLARAFDPVRFALIAKEALRHISNFGPFVLIGAFALLALYAAAAGLRRRNPDRVTVRTGSVALALTAAGYFLIYQLRSRDLLWLLDSSLDRLLIQLWPSIVFVVFLACRPQAEVGLNQLRAEAEGDLVGRGEIERARVR